MSLIELQIDQATEGGNASADTAYLSDASTWKKNKQKDLAYYGAIINSDLGISRAVERLNTEPQEFVWFEIDSFEIRRFRGGNLWQLMHRIVDLCFIFYIHRLLI
jgi:hypothetical protein